MSLARPRAMSRPVELVTFGCRLNIVESEIIRVHAERAGLADTVIVNTCAVTAEAERQARQAIRRLRRERPQARIVVTGCAAQIAPQLYATLDGVDRVLGNDEKLRPEIWRTSQRLAVAEIMAANRSPPPSLAELDGHSRAFLQIQNGCDHRCTFCVIPYGRGNSRSVPLGEIVAQARGLLASGYRELVLTGVDLTAYGADLPGRPGLALTIRRLLELLPDLERLRLSSLDVAEIDGELLRAFGSDQRVMPHAHLSLQSGDDFILKRMKRRHRRAQAVEICEALRRTRPDLVLGADLIAGFPTEDDQAFANTEALIEQCGLTYLHVFPYSARTGTPAARMPQVPGDVRRARARRLRAIGAARLDRYLRGKVATRARVLVELDGNGRDQHYAPVRLDFPARPRTIVEVEIASVEDDHLVGREIAPGGA